MDFYRLVFTSGDFQPHGFCYLWNSGLVWLNVISDLLIALAYFTIPVTLLHFIRKRRDLPFSWMFGLFGVFIIACGATHVMEGWNLWHAQYWLAGVTKTITAAASVPSAILENSRDITQRKLEEEKFLNVFEAAARPPSFQMVKQGSTTILAESVSWAATSRKGAQP